MITILPIQSLDDPRLRPYRTLRQPVEHEREGIFVAEGEKVVRRFVESDLTVTSVLLTPEWLLQYREILEKRVEQIEVFVGEKELLETIVGYRLHQGVMAVGRIPVPADLQRIIRNTSHPLLFVALDGLTNSENLGVVVRNCGAFGVDGLIVGETCSSPYLRRAVRNSMGAVFKLHVVHAINLVATLTMLHSDRAVEIIAAHPRPKSTSLTEVDFSKNCCVVFGSEGEGISVEVLSACGKSVSIPMHNGVDSLNVASAHAVVLYEIRRQRGKR